MVDYELKDIRTDIIEACQNIPVVIDFWAAWCGPCKALGPILEKLASQANGKWKFVKVDVENPQNQSLAAQFQIRSIPAVRMIYQGKVIAHFDGSLPEAEVKKWLSEHLPLSEDQEPEGVQVDELIESGNREAALELAKQNYNNDKESDDNKVQLAFLLLPKEVETAEKLISSLKEEGKYEIEREALNTIKRINQLVEGSINIDSEKTDLKTKYINGCKAILNEDFEVAAETLIQIIMADRSLDEDGARKVCVALFKMLGEKHPVTKKFRRRFSMALY